MYRSSERDQSFEVIFFNISGSFSIRIQITELIIVRFCIEVGHMPFRSVFLFEFRGGEFRFWMAARVSDVPRR